MKYLSLSRDGTRLTLTVEAARPLRAACEAVRGARSEGVSGGLAVYSYPALPDVWADLRLAFAPEVSGRAAAVVRRLEASAAAIAQANERKGRTGGRLVFDAGLASTPMAHQVEAMNFCWSLFEAQVPGAALLMEQGTGKSLCCVGLANGLFRSGRVTWALVLAPNSLKGTWGAEDGEVAKHSADEHQLTILRGTKPRRTEQLRRFLASQSQLGLSWVVTNYDQLGENPRKSQHLRDLHELVAKAGPGLLVADESTVVKNPSANRTRAVLELAPLFTHRLILTGTPITRSPLDAWSQFEVLEKAALGYPRYSQFERTYAVYQRQTVGRGASKRSFYAVVNYRNLPDLEERVARMSYRVRAADCLDLPPVTVQRLDVEVSPEQDKALRSLRREMMAEMDSGQVVDGRNVLTRYLRMAQILGGWVPALRPDGRPGKVEAFDPNPKLMAAQEYLQLALSDPEAKAVVFAQFRAELDALEKLCRKEGWGVGAIHGGVSEQDRDAARQRFQTDPDTRVMVCQYQAGSKGLTLTAANHLLFYSLTFSLEDYLQARKRVHRFGQDRHVNEAYLIAQGRPYRGKRRQTLDQVVLRALESKRQLADLVTGDAGREMLEAL